MSTIEESVDLAKQIYALKVVLTPHWDKQQQARDAFVAATQFLIALSAEKGETESVEEEEPEEKNPPAQISGKEVQGGSPNNKTTQKVT